MIDVEYPYYEGWEKNHDWKKEFRESEERLDEIYEAFKVTGYKKSIKGVVFPRSIEWMPQNDYNTVYNAWIYSVTEKEQTFMLQVDKGVSGWSWRVYFSFGTKVSMQDLYLIKRSAGELETRHDAMTEIEKYWGWVVLHGQ